MSNPDRIRPGVREGGQFATGARSEPEVSLAAKITTTVHVGGHVGQQTEHFAEAIRATPMLGEVEFWAEVDNDDGRFIGTATIHGNMYSFSRYDADTYRLSPVGGGYNDAVGDLDDMATTFEDSLRKVRARALAEEVRKEVNGQFAGEPSNRLPVALRRSDTVIEAGFALPGDHIKVRMVSEDPQAQLFAHSPISDDALEMTDRQRTLRLNKVLDHVGPDRQQAKEHLRNYLQTARHKVDERTSADPLLGG